MKAEKVKSTARELCFTRFIKSEFKPLSKSIMIKARGAKKISEKANQDYGCN